MRRLFLVLLLLAQSLLFSAPAQAGHDPAGWDSLLKKHVVSLHGGQVTQVDYAGFKADRSLLRRYLSLTSDVARADFERWSKLEQLAFLINAYNAWTVELVLGVYPDLASIKDLGSLLQSPWKKRFIPLLGETRSLDEIEHGLIRASGHYNDPRVHFAVNCASIGCPALRAEAYVAERLDAQLEDATTAFLSDRSRNRLEGEVLKVSSIFKWYRDDFEKGWHAAHHLGGFLSLYQKALKLGGNAASRLVAGELAIQFQDYDWRLNATPGGQP
ncbi:MAG: DUF547 domain-containing protein [Burkholderiales bacterium]|nr:DUF547 domain-containing protein [Burkholderiales bacterium]